MNHRFLLALLVGIVVAAAGAVVIKVMGASEAWGWAVVLVALFAASFADREGFYGTPPRSRH